MADEKELEKAVVEGEVGAPAPAEGEKAAGTPPAQQPSPPTETPPPPEPAKGAWPKSALDRVAKLTARLREYEARGAGAPKPVDPGTGQPLTQEQIDQFINERAVAISAQQRFNTDCNEAAQRGAQKFPDWKQKLDGLTQLVDQTDMVSVSNYNVFLQAALETGDAEGIIHKLGGDLNEAARILSLPPVKMTMEVGKLSRGLEKGDPSKLPRPIRPVGSSAPTTATKPDDPERGKDLSMDDWMKARAVQVKERGIR